MVPYFTPSESEQTTKKWSIISGPQFVSLHESRNPAFNIFLLTSFMLTSMKRRAQCVDQKTRSLVKYELLWWEKSNKRYMKEKKTKALSNAQSDWRKIIFPCPEVVAKVFVQYNGPPVWLHESLKWRRRNVEAVLKAVRFSLQVFFLFFSFFIVARIFGTRKRTVLLPGHDLEKE